MRHLEDRCDQLLTIQVQLEQTLTQGRLRLADPLRRTEDVAHRALGPGLEEGIDVSDAFLAGADQVAFVPQRP